MWSWWPMSAIQALVRLRQQDHELEASQGYIMSSVMASSDHFKITQTQQKQQKQMLRTGINI
jgi:hypothetical protein